MSIRNQVISNFPTIVTANATGNISDLTIPGNVTAATSVTTNTILASGNIVSTGLGTFTGNITAANGIFSRGSTALFTAISDEYVKVGSNTSGNSGSPVVIGVTSANSVFAGLRLNKGNPSAERWYMGCDNTNLQGNFVINANGSTVLTIANSTQSIATSYIAYPYRSIVRRASATSVPNASDTSINFDNSDLDTANGWINWTGQGSNIFQNVSGRQLFVNISYQISYEGNTAGARVSWINLGNVSSNQNRLAMLDMPASPDFPVQSSSLTFPLSAGNTFSLYTWQNSGAARTQGAAAAGQLTSYSTKINITILG